MSGSEDNSWDDDSGSDSGTQNETKQEERVGQCMSCGHGDKVLVEGRPYCSVCLMGIRMGGLRYTCDRCNGVQRITHPMWKYQETPSVKTTATWACHVGCYDYTRWFIHPDDIAKIPTDLIPATWHAQKQIQEQQQQKPPQQQQEEDEHQIRQQQQQQQQQQKAEERVGRCGLCCQSPKNLVEGGPYCSVCLTGIKMGGLRYTCNRCNRVQRISHPMWKYQETPSVKTWASWACHVGCGDYTRWYIHPDDIDKIPTELIPATWPPQQQIEQLEQKEQKHEQKQQQKQQQQQQPQKPEKQQQQNGRVGQCMSCGHTDKVLVEGTRYCSVCLMGIKMGALRYTCDGCNRVQRIAHPMWKYQETPTVKTTATWACHVGCNNYTRWFIHPDDIDKIPTELIPATWAPKKPQKESRGRLSGN